MRYKKIDGFNFKRGLLLAFVVALLAGTLSILGPSEVMAAKIKLFDTRELKSNNLKKFKKWNGVLERYQVEEPDELAKCKLSETQKCAITKWRIFLNKVKKEPNKEKQIGLVNKYLNKRLYIIDPTNYKKKDYWATPLQFVNRNGDCEDYAISKYLSLVHLGFDKNDMRIVVLQDLNLGVPHAILVVYINDKALVLDNQITSVVEANRIKHYKPIFSINEKSWWLHRG